MTTQKKMRGKEKVAAAAAKMAAGVPQVFGGSPSILLPSGATTPADMQAQLTKLVGLRAAVDAARAAFEAAVAVENAQGPELVTFMSEIEAFARATFGTDPVVLGKLGLTPRRARAELSTTEKAASVAKAAGTREARHTTGPKAKLAIHGDVVGVEVTPITASPPAPAAPAVEAPRTGVPATTAPHA